MSMDINIMLISEVECVYLINGKFFEGDRFTTTLDTVLYITVLPLDARFAPYSVKLIGCKAACNEALALCCKIGDREYAIRLGKRYSFVFSENHKNLPDDPSCKFFYLVKGGNFGLASEMLTSELAAELNERELKEFFGEFLDLIKVKDSYFAVDRSGLGHHTTFAYKGGKIDNISID